MKKLLPIIILLTAFVFFGKRAHSSHAMGGDIWYECNGGNSYTIFFAFYRDCDGNDAPNSISISYGSSCSATEQVSLTKIPGTGQDITPVCAGQTSTCNGGTFPGVEKYVYSATINLTNCTDWVFSTSVCCRNNAITNINDPGGEEMYLQATLDNLNHPCNSSPIFTSDPVPYICVGETFCFNHGAIDAEGDSLSFRLANPLDQGPTDPVVYNSGFSAAQPISSSPAVSFNGNNGDICITPSAIEVSVTAVVIEHWNNGSLVGTTMRDIQVVVVNCNNILPVLNGIDGSNIYETNACAGNTISFTTNGSDLDGANNLTMSWNGAISGATFNVSNNDSPNPVGSFSWSPTLSDISNTPYCFTVTIQDDQCPLNGFQIYSYCITVGSGNVTTSTIAQDINCNGTCDGEVTVSGSGGVSPYDFSPDGVNYVAASLFDGLCSGDFGFYARDANGCSSVDSVSLTEPDDLLLSTSSTPVSCNGGANGLASVSVMGGTSPYTYSWSNGPTTSSNSGLSSGTYTVTVTDDKGCVALANENVPQPSAVTLSTTPTHLTCAGNDGEILVTTNGGVTGYTYAWSHDASHTGNQATGLDAGDYTIIATDALGCTGQTSRTLNLFDFAEASFAYSGNQCLTGNLYYFANTGTSGVGVSHEWNFGDGIGSSTLESPTYSYLSAGTFVVEHVVVEGSCSDTNRLTIEVYDGPDLDLTSVGVPCFGENGANINLTTIGGNPNFGFAWSNGAITEDLFGVAVGTYSVIVSDNNGCLSFDTITITEPSQLTMTSTQTDATCFGVCDGQVNVIPTGGTSPYTFLWDDPSSQTTSSAINLCHGNHEVEVTDANGCIISEVFSINNSDTVIISTVVTQSSCSQSDGEIAASSAGGTGPYSYVWTPGNVMTPTITGVPAGTYNVEVVDAIGCIGVGSDVISDVPAPNAVIDGKTDVVCFGDSTGSANVIASGGSGTYFYSWAPYGGSNSVANSLASGNYVVTVTDDLGCVTEASVFINQSSEMSAFMGFNPANCGLSDGAVFTAVSGGNGGYTYEWTDESNNFEGSLATIPVDSGWHYVFVEDVSKCTYFDSVFVSNIPGGTASATSEDVLCFGACTGRGSATMSGGTLPYQFVWDNPSATENRDVVGLCAGDYQVTVTDGIGCTSMASITINQPTELALTMASNDVSCYGFTNGTASVTSTGGTGPYTYLWSANAGNAVSQSVSALAPGAYSVVVTDLNGCSAVGEVTIGEPQQIILASSFSNAHCGLSDGSAMVDVTGGIAPLSFSWTGSGSVANQANNIPQGTYTVTVTDDDGCTENTDVLVGDTPAGTAVVTNTVNPNCFNSCNGSATVSMSGSGQAPFVYNWNNPSFSTEVSADGMCGNVPYTVSVTDVNGCVSQASVTLNNPISISINLNPQDAICHGECTGAINSEVTGGSAPYTFMWNDPSQQTTSNAVNLCPLTSYTLSVTDANGCMASNFTSLGQPTDIEIDSTVVNAFCGQSNGSACVSISGGIPGYDINWTHNNASSVCESNLLAGTYVVEVTDLNDCPAQTIVTVTDIEGPTSTSNVISDVLCAGDLTGQATALVDDGTSPFSYQWDVNAKDQTTPTASNLGAGTYTYTIVDSAGCATSGSVTITEPDPLTISPSIFNPLCTGNSDGRISATIFGGTAPYTYSWSHDLVLNSASATGLPAGNYSLTVTDAHGCDEFVVLNLVDPVPFSNSISATDVGCNGECTGSSTVTPITGNAPFNYLWNDSNMQTTQVASGLCFGTFEAVVTDVNGCVDSVSITIEEPDTLLASVSLAGNVTCHGDCDGFAEAAGVGGTLPYTYDWSNGETTQLISNVCAGNYSGVVVDANGCSAEFSQFVDQPLALNSSIIIEDARCFDATDGSANYLVSGGVTPYSYLWNDPGFQTTSLASNLGSGQYNVTAEDANGCVITQTVSVNEPSLLDVAIDISNSNCGQSNGMLCASAIGGVGNYGFQWNDQNLQTTACALAVPAGNYAVTVTDGNNCVIDTIVNVIDISGPTVDFVSENHIVCNGESNGSVVMSVFGGTTPYSSYQWTDNNSGNVVGNPSNPLLTGVPVGCYTLEVIDNVGCVNSITRCLNEPPPINSAFTSINDVTCHGACNGSALLLTSGGTGNLNITWDSGQTTHFASGLCGGSHTINISDDNLCTASNSITIEEPAILTTTQIGDSETSCEGICDGSIQLLSSGGTAPYTYNWAPNVTSTNLASELCPGDYLVTTTDAQFCQTITNYTITSPQLLTATISATDATCSECNATVNLTVGGGTGPYQYHWLDGQSSSTATSVCEGNFEGTAIDANGCSLTLNTSIVNMAGPEISGFNKTDLICFEDNSGMAEVLFSGGTAPVTILWTTTPQSSNPAVSLSSGNHCVKLIDNNGCEAFNCVNLTEPSELFGVPDVDATICFGDSTQLWASAVGGIGPYTYSWSAPLIGLTDPGPHYVSPETNTSYCFDVTDAIGCPSTIQSCINIDVTAPLEIDILSNVNVCAGDSIDIFSTAIGGDGNPYIYEWYFEDVNGSKIDSVQNLIGEAVIEGTYYVILKDGCSINAIDSTVVLSAPLPTIDISVLNPSICFPDPIRFDVVSDIGTSFAWDFDSDGIIDFNSIDTLATNTYPSVGTYNVSITVTSDAGCVATLTDTALVNLLTPPSADFDVVPSVVSLVNPLANVFDNSSPSISWDWDFNNDNIIDDSVRNSIYEYTSEGTYEITLTITDSAGCKASTFRTILVEDENTIFVPNAFTPNGDLINDTFFAQGLLQEVRGFRFEVFDRWGQLIWKGTSPTSFWDGTTLNGVKSQDGMYIWKMELAYDFEVIKKLQGHVFLLR